MDHIFGGQVTPLLALEWIVVIPCSTSTNTSFFHNSMETPVSGASGLKSALILQDLRHR